MHRLGAALGFVLLCGAPILAAPPTDPQARKIYDHDKEWLSHFPNSFIAANIRGEDQQYAERRQAALDMIRERSDRSVAGELIEEMRRGSFLSGDICDMFAEWRTPQALPLLKQVATDRKRPKEVRQKAQHAIHAINNQSLKLPSPLSPTGDC